MESSTKERTGNKKHWRKKVAHERVHDENRTELKEPAWKIGTLEDESMK